MDNKPKTPPVKSRFQRILRQSAEYVHQFADYLDHLSKSGETPASDNEVIENAKRISRADQRSSAAQRCFVYRLFKSNWPRNLEKIQPMVIPSGTEGEYIECSERQIAEGFLQYRNHIHDRYGKTTLIRVYEAILTKVAIPCLDKAEINRTDIANGMLEVSAIIDEAEKSRKIRFLMFTAIAASVLVALYTASR